MALNVSIFRNPGGDFTKHGISSYASELCLLNVDGPDIPRGEVMVAFLVKGNAKGLVKIVPSTFDTDGKCVPTTEWTMMGGNFAYTPDSRFHRAVEAITGSPSYGAVPIHDRIES